jgi:hypothetical protein
MRRRGIIYSRISLKRRASRTPQARLPFQLARAWRIRGGGARAVNWLKGVSSSQAEIYALYPLWAALDPKRSIRARGRNRRERRVEVWRGGFRPGISVCRPFRLAGSEVTRRGANGLTA